MVVAVVNLHVAVVLAHVLELRHGCPHARLPRILDAAKEGVGGAAKEVMVHVPRLVWRKGGVKVWHDLGNVRHDVFLPLADPPHLRLVAALLRLEGSGQGNPHRHVAKLQQVARLGGDGEVVGIHHVTCAPAHAGGQRAGNRLRLHNQPPGVGRGGEGGAKARGGARKEVGEGANVPSTTPSCLVGDGTLVKVRGQDLVVKEKEVVLEGDAPPQANVAGYEEREAPQVLLVVKAPDGTANLLTLGVRLHEGQLDDPLARDANLLVLPVDHHYDRATGEGDGGDGLVALALHGAGRKRAGARREVALDVALHDALEEVSRRHPSISHDIHLVVLHTEVNGQRGVLQGDDAQGLKLLHEGVNRGAHQGHLVHDGLPHHGLVARVFEVAHGGVRLVPPNAHLDGRAKPRKGGLHLGDDHLQVIQAAAVGTTDHHGHLASHHLPHNVVWRDARPAAAEPAEDVALNAGIGGTGLIVFVASRRRAPATAGIQLGTHAGARLGDEGTVVGLDHEVQVGAGVGGFVLANEVLDAAGLATLCIEYEDLNLRVQGAHCGVREVLGRHAAGLLIKAVVYFQFLFGLKTFCLHGDNSPQRRLS